MNGRLTSFYRRLRVGLLLLCLTGPAGLTASAVMIFSSGTLNLDIPDDATLVSNSLTVSGAPSLTNGVSVGVQLNITGGYNGDLYAYLVYDDVTVVLLNRIGLTEAHPYGAAGEGMNVTLVDGSPDIHQAGDTVLTGVWSPDGRLISPLSSGAEFDAAPRDYQLSQLAGYNPNGVWELFLADMESGAQSRLVNWSLLIGNPPIVAVPEPGILQLFVCGALIVVYVYWRKRRRSQATPAS